MKKLTVNKLVPGMVTAENVYTYTNQLILPKGLVLTDKSITKLEFYSILRISVEDDVMPTAPVDETKSYSQRVRESQEFKEYKKNFESSVVELKKNIDAFVDKNIELNPDELLKQVLSLMNPPSGRINVFTMLHNMRMYDDLTYAHCINTSLVCNVIATWMKLPEEDIHLVTLSGLLHDIGKIRIPDTIIKKKGKLSEREYEVVKTHTIEGYNLLKNTSVNEHIKNAALMHHERFDGSGYPMGLVGNKIDYYARIVAVADVYEAMTSARVYRGPLCPFTALAIFISEGLQKYDPEVILPFMQNIVTTYIGSRVRLNNGVEGDIVYINQANPASPTIKSGANYIDLSQETDLSIDCII